MPNAAQNAAQQSDYRDKPMPAFMSRRSLKVGVRLESAAVRRLALGGQMPAH